MIGENIKMRGNVKIHFIKVTQERKHYKEKKLLPQKIITIFFAFKYFLTIHRD